MNTLFDFPYPFYRYSNVTYAPTYKTEEIDGKIVGTIELPGRDKEEIDIKYQSESRSIRVEVKDGPNFSIYLSRQIDSDNITAELAKGILTIEAPIRNTDKRIDIK